MKFLSMYHYCIINAGLKNEIVVTTPVLDDKIISILLSKPATTVKCDGTASGLL